MATFNETTRKDLFLIDPRQIIVAEGFNARQDFDLDSIIESIRENGVHNPLSVQKIEKDGETRYQLVDGERRYRAVMRIIEEGGDIARVPAIILPRNLSKEMLLVEQIIRNEGKPFTDYEWAIACYKFVELGYKNNEIAQKLGKKPVQVNNWLSLMDYAPEITEYVKDGKINLSQFHEIAKTHRDTNGCVNERSLLRELQKADRNSQDTNNGKTKKITLKDLDPNSKAVIKQDTKTIRIGLEKLFSYIRKEAEKNDNFEIDFYELYTDIKKNGKTIVEAISACHFQDGSDMAV